MFKGPTGQQGFEIKTIYTEHNNRLHEVVSFFVHLSFKKAARQYS